MTENELEYAGFWARTGATLIDTTILLLITWPLLISIYGWDYFGDDKAFFAGPADVLISWVIPIIGTILFWLYKQATPGKMVISGRIVDERTGNTMSVGQSIGRYLAYFISAIPLGLGFIWIAFDSKKQGWHDKLAGTVVVRAKAARVAPVQFDKS